MNQRVEAEAGPEARPVDAGERLEVLDVLRGFALCGVFVSNVYVWFSGRVLMPWTEVQARTESSWTNQVANELFQFFVNGLTYGKAQPMRKNPAPIADVASVA